MLLKSSTDFVQQNCHVNIFQVACFFVVLEVVPTGVCQDLLQIGLVLRQLFTVPQSYQLNTSLL